MTILAIIRHFKGIKRGKKIGTFVGFEPTILKQKDLISSAFPLDHRGMYLLWSKLKVKKFGQILEFATKNVI